MRETSTIHRRPFSITPALATVPTVEVTPRLGLSLLLLSLLLLLLLPRHALAQVNNANMWRLYEANDGLPSNDVWTVLEVGDAVWVATAEGIVRYDGSWTRFQYVRTPGSGPATGPAASDAIVDDNQGALTLPLQDGVLHAMVRGREPGTIWAASSSGEVVFWDGRMWHREFALPALLYDLALYDGKIYAATERGLYVFDPARGSAELVPAFRDIPIVTAYADDLLWIGTENGLYVLSKPDTWAHLALPAHFGVNAVSAIVVDDEGYLWVGTPAGVAWLHLPDSVWSGEVMPVADERGDPTTISALTKDPDGSIWAASNGGGARKFVAHGYRDVDVARASGGGLTTPLVRDIATDSRGSVWFATPVGLFQYQEGRWLSDYIAWEGADRRLNNVNELLVARDGSIWIATGGAGIRRKKEEIDSYRETVYNMDQGDLPSDGVTALAEDRDGAIWAGSFAGVSRFRDGHWSDPVDANALPSPVVTDLLATPTHVWIGTEFGLVDYDMDAASFTWMDQTLGSSVEALVLDNANRLWVGTRDNGIMVRDADGNWAHMRQGDDKPSALPGVGIQTNGLALDPRIPDGMWAIVTGVGLAHFDGVEWNSVDGSALSNLPYRLFTDPNDGSLWIGGEGGVSHYDGTTWGAFTTRDGLQSSAIYAIAYEPQGRYWFGGAEGLTRYTPDRDRPWVRRGKADNLELGEDGNLVARQDVPAILYLDSGDLQTPQEELKLYYRMAGATEWEELQDSFLPLKFDQIGRTTIEVMARDQAFNYSEVLEQPITVAAQLEYVTMPVLGKVERSIFWTLMFLAATAILGFGYASFEIIQSHLRAIDALNRGFNPYVSGEPVRQGDMFFGRRDLLQKIIDTLHNNSIMIHGERRIGKTTLLYQLANALREVDDPEFRFLPIYVDLEGTIETEFFHYLMEEIALGALSLKGVGARVEPVVAGLRYHDAARDEYTDRDFAQDLRHLVSALQDAISAVNPEQRLRLILLLDEVDVLSRYDQLVQQQLRRIFMRDFAATMGAVVAGIQISKEWDRVESPWFNMFNEIALQPFTREQALELLIEPVRNIYRYDPETLDFIIEKSNGRPYRLQQYALIAVNYMLARRHRRIFLEDAHAAHEDIETAGSYPYATIQTAESSPEMTLSELA